MVETVETIADETPQPTSMDDIKPKMKLTGVVKRLELYGAFIDIGLDVNALIHISQLGEERVNRVSDVLNIGDEVTVWVDKIDPERQQVMVTMLEPLAVEWSDLKVGQVYTGKVSRLENFGAFIDIGAEREGLVHISELSHDFVRHPREVIAVGDEVQVQVLGFSKRKRRIDLSIKNLLEKPEPVVAAVPENRKAPEEYTEEVEDDVLPTAMEVAMRAAMGDMIKISSQRKSANRRRRRREKGRAQQEEILDRTLHVQQSR
jgi:ribosomal protein S1